MTNKLTNLLLWVLLFCTALARAADPMPAGPLQSSTISFDLLIIYPASKPPAPALKPLLASKWPGLTLVEKIPANPAAMFVQMTSHPAFDPIGAEWLKYFARGLNADQSAAMQTARPFLQLRFAHGKKDTFTALRAAYELASHLARKDGGLIWDAETRELFAPAQWDERRLSSWTEQYPVAAGSTVIHSYANGELLRQITLGMGKFGLPDIVANQVAHSSSESMGNLINLLSQALVEGAAVGPGGNLDLSLDKIVNQSVRSKALGSLKSGAQKVARVQLLKGNPEEGDPDNRLIAIGFDRHPGPDGSARQQALLTSLYGANDAIVRIRHDDELRAASAKARQKLAAMRDQFKRGLGVGEYIQVKAPFKTDSGGNEWMWVEIQRWEGDRIDGSLQNTPFEIKALKSGQLVRIREQDVFDYIRKFTDGHVEGNTTGDIIRKMQDATTK